MFYVLSIIAGIISGSAVNVYTGGQKASSAVLKWYMGHFHKKFAYLFTEVITALIYLYLYQRTAGVCELLKFWVFSALLMAAAIQDFKKREISNALTAAFMFSGMLFVLFSFDLGAVLDSLLAFTVFGGIFLFISFVTNGGIGAGDVKLVACSGLFLGLGGLWTAVAAALFLTFAGGIALLVLRLTDRKGFIPFAPFVLAGFLASVF